MRRETDPKEVEEQKIIQGLSPTNEYLEMISVTQKLLADAEDKILDIENE